MKTYSAVIYTDHALTKKTENDFEVCELRGDHVRRVGDVFTHMKFFNAVIVATMVRFAARNGQIFDKGYWLVSMSDHSRFKVRFTTIPLETE